MVWQPFDPINIAGLSVVRKRVERRSKVIEKKNTRRKEFLAHIRYLHPQCDTSQTGVRPCGTSFGKMPPRVPLDDRYAHHAFMYRNTSVGNLQLNKQELNCRKQDNLSFLPR